MLIEPFQSVCCTILFLFLIFNFPQHGPFTPSCSFGPGCPKGIRKCLGKNATLSHCDQHLLPKISSNTQNKIFKVPFPLDCDKIYYNHSKIKSISLNSVMFQDFVLFIQENKSAYLIAREPGL